MGIDDLLVWSAAQTNKKGASEGSIQYLALVANQKGPTWQGLTRHCIHPKANTQLVKRDEVNEAARQAKRRRSRREQTSNATPIKRPSQPHNLTNKTTSLIRNDSTFYVKRLECLNRYSILSFVLVLDSGP
ncbi:hypothetical protein AAF712_008002 [Marasmius tenuissimus]|uniref:Uncharacterized protein n=1 Tax=Marasmius tenuissimus TaxID=585030 RepID=A0ABR2ZTK2_9AGAR|nr:hypothetical protein PM082_012282 [Marasmius tenuissimus]